MQYVRTSTYPFKKRIGKANLTLRHSDTRSGTKEAVAKINGLQTSNVPPRQSLPRHVLLPSKVPGHPGREQQINSQSLHPNATRRIHGRYLMKTTVT
jgi:hypothetical protein